MTTENLERPTPRDAAADLSDARREMMSIARNLTPRNRAIWFRCGDRLSRGMSFELARRMAAREADEAAKGGAS